MGKAMKWLRAMLGLKKEKDADHSNSAAGDKKEKNRWSFSKSGKDSTGIVQSPVGIQSDADQQGSYLARSRREQNKHAIAVAAASAAAADAAMAAAQAAAAVVRLRNRQEVLLNGKVTLAALKIQNVFRGHLARKALRALKGLVKLQALVRGYLVRKRAAATFHSMQALIRAQTTVRSQRARRSHNKENKSEPKTKPKQPMDDLKWINPIDFENPKIVEIDSFKPGSRTRRYHSLLSESGDDRPYYSTVASPARFTADEWRVSAQSMPRVMDSGWVNPPWTPAKSFCGDGFFRPYSNFPSYMANTQSFKAKLRSRSAPKQRPDVWSKKRVALDEILGPRNSVSSIRMQRYCHHVGEEEEQVF